MAAGSDAEEYDLYAARCVADGIIRERDDVGPPHSVVEQQRQLLCLSAATLLVLLTLLTKRTRARATGSIVQNVSPKMRKYHHLHIFLKDPVGFSPQ